MKLTIVGFWGAYPGKGGATSGYLVQTEHYTALLDCGSAVLSKLHGYVDINELESVVLSHYHPDHTADIGVLQHAVIVQKALKNRIKPLAFYGHTEDPSYKTLALPNYTSFIEYKGGEKYPVGPFTFTFIKTLHPVTAFSMRIEYHGKSIGYTGDTQWNDQLPAFFRDVDILLCEASLFSKFKGSVSGHLTASEAGELADRASAGRLILTHLPHYGNHDDLLTEASAVYSGPVELAAEGKFWEI